MNPEEETIDEFRRLVMWFGDPQKDILTAKDWIESVQRAKDQSKWDDEETMNNVVCSLFADALFWFFDLVHTQCAKDYGPHNRAYKYRGRLIYVGLSSYLAQIIL